MGLRLRRNNWSDKGVNLRYRASVPHPFTTERLLLRRWLPMDQEPFAALNADPRVMEHFPSTLSREQSDALVEQIEASFDQNGFGLWAVEVPNIARFVGFIGLAVPRFEAHFTPCVEIGWRIAPEYWNRGYASEGARAALAFGLKHCTGRDCLLHRAW